MKNQMLRLQKEASFSKKIIEKAAEGICVGCSAPPPLFVEFSVWNDKMTAITGYTLEEINRLGWPNALQQDPDKRRETQRIFTLLSQGNEVSGLEREIDCKTGERKIVNISTSILDTEDGRLHMLAFVQDVTARKKYEALLVERANRDYLTGIANRRALFTRLEKEVARAARVEACLSVLLFDLDFFKLVNDTYGHLVGDETLKRVSALIASELRIYDEVGRFGGEEFLVVAPETCLDGACNVANRIRDKIALTIMRSGETAFSVTTSVGVSQLRSGDTVDELIKRADDNLYLAKSSGRNQVRC
ncbi:hypothetical protein JCM15519_23490 [Fundidesulfovibrio butyratiphilus]